MLTLLQYITIGLRSNGGKWGNCLGGLGLPFLQRTEISRPNFLPLWTEKRSQLKTYDQTE